MYISLFYFHLPRIYVFTLTNCYFLINQLKIVTDIDAVKYISYIISTSIGFTMMYIYSLIIYI